MAAAGRHVKQLGRLASAGNRDLGYSLGAQGLWRAGALPCAPTKYTQPSAVCSSICSRPCQVNSKPTQPCMLKHGKTSKAHISITVSDRPMIFFLLGRPRVGLVYSTLAFEVKVMSRSRVPNQMPTTRNQAHNSVTMSLGPRIIVARVGPRVGPMTLTLTSTLKVIPRSNAPNDFKVSANVSEVILGHPRASPSSLDQ